MNHKTQLPDSRSIHGVFLDVLDLGVLLTGVSGIGKSEIALGLINRGHRLIADDAVLFTRQDNQQVIGSCSPVLQDFLEVRGLGILNIRAMFGDSAIKPSKQLDLIVNIISISSIELQHLDRLNGMHRNYDMLGIDIPEVSIPVAPGRNLSILIEGAVRNQILKAKGYNAGHDFTERQRTFIERDHNGS